MVATLQNPLSEGLRIQRSAEPCTVVIFGASGDLTKRKLLPALYSLAQQNLVASGFSVVGTSRTQMTHEAFREATREALTEFTESGIDETVWKNFALGLYYLPTDTSNPQSYRDLAKLLDQVDRERGTSGNRLFYLSTPPSIYVDIIKGLGENHQQTHEKGGWRRIIIEKPFGHDLESARSLNREALAVFSENQIYRIDHYLGKETVQNIIVLRFSNGIFEPVWNRYFIDHVQITAAENIGVENRGGYYEQSGAFRDMIQNHMMQLAALVAMEPPVDLQPNSVRDEKTKVTRAMRDFTIDEVDQLGIRGQYGEGAIGGQKVKGYRQEPNVNPSSNVETYAAFKILIDNSRWADVPFYLRSGKRLPKRVSEIAIQFKRPPHLLFKHTLAGELEPNFLVLRIQPDEGISLKFGAKLPGQAIQIRSVNMDFQYGSSFGRRSPEAYERLLLDAMLGDSTLFARGDMVELSWELVMPVLERWQQTVPNFPNYEAGEWGPAEAEALLEKDGRRWRRP